MKVLAIDTSNRPLSVAVLDDDNLLVTKTTNVSYNHSVTLMPIVAELLKESNLTPAQIDRLVVAQGPGSYTGLRIGVTAAKTLASTLNKELVGVSSLKLVAANIYPRKKVLIVPYFDARNGNVFAGGYVWDKGTLVNRIEDQHISFEKLVDNLVSENKSVIFVGIRKAEFEQSAQAKLDSQFEFADLNYQMPQAVILGRLGQKEEPSDADTFVPQYRRLTQAELQWMEKHPEEKNHHGNYVEKV